VRRSVVEAPAVDVPAAPPLAPRVTAGDVETGPGSEPEPAPPGAPEPVEAPAGEVTEEQPVVEEAGGPSDAPEGPLGEPPEERPARRWFRRRGRAEDAVDSSKLIDREPVPAAAEAGPPAESPRKP